VRQWAYDGKPLYSYVNDEKAGEAKGELIDKRWHIQPHKPGSGLETPDGIFVQERTNAGGQTLVDARHNTLYVFDGDVAGERTRCPERTQCVNHWHPLVAPELANRVGDFSAVARADGITQWAYRGKRLYTSDLDTDLGDANGEASDPRYRVALIERYFIPKEVMIIHDSKGFDILATIGGKTLYTRSQYNLGTTQGLIKHSVQRGPPELGKELSIDTCNAECLAKWTPLRAQAGATAAGYWSVLNREDGTKQWAYEGYALYTYSGDVNPGDEEGHDIFDLDTRVTPRLPDPLFVRGANAIYWHVVEVFSGS
jgi:predicted lipoprotein with Yx(FWY)xxD motif